MTLFNFISPFTTKSQSGLPLFQQHILVLIKLRLNIANQYLGYQFGVHHSTISRYFRKLIVMYERLKPIILWPERNELLKTMPVDVKKTFKKCIVIIGFEGFI